MSLETAALIAGVAAVTGGAIGGGLAGEEEAEAFLEQGKEAMRFGREKSRITGEQGERVKSSQQAGAGAANVQQKGSIRASQIETLAQTFRQQESIMASARAEQRAYKKRASAARRSGWASALSSMGSMALTGGE